MYIKTNLFRKLFIHVNKIDIYQLNWHINYMNTSIKLI